MRKYLIVRVEEADEEFPSKPVISKGVVEMPRTNMGRIRNAVHEAADTHFIHVSDAPTHSMFKMFTPEEESMIEEIFETALERVRNRGNTK